MRLSVLLNMVLLLSSISAIAQTSKSDYYYSGLYTYSGIQLPYRQLSLNQDKSGKTCLVIQLHGGSARGDDNTAQLVASAVDSVENYLRTRGLKAIFLLPQCAADRVWNENSRNYSVTMTDVLYHWLKNYIAQHDIDINRVFITGYSAGGSGTWRMVNDYPGLFAASAIAAANPVMVDASHVKSTPVYAIAGSDDTIMDYAKIESFVSSIIENGGNAKYDLLEGKDHFGTCDTAFTAERLDWMFSNGIQQSTDLGDINNDGQVDILDVTKLINLILH